MAEAKVGIIGGTGLYHMEGMAEIKAVAVKTPFGDPSGEIVTGRLEGAKVAFLPRHGRGHRISPTEVPVRANIYALKSLGMERIISVNAVGSLKEELRPLDLVIPDQLIDMTRHRVTTFFSGGIVAHVAFAEPFCPLLSQEMFEAARRAGIRPHQGGTYLTMEGPQFSTRAESNLYRSWGADIIGMTAATEAKLAREAEMCYASLSFVTDYDCWREATDVVTAEIIVANLQKNVETARHILRKAIALLPERRDCLCGSALENAFVTLPELIPEQIKRDLAPLIGKYVKQEGTRAQD